MDPTFARSSAELRLAAVAALMLLAAPPTVAQGSDDLWDVNVKMEIVGMPFPMPPVAQRLCVRKGGNDNEFVPKRENCSVSDARRSGNKLSFRMACTGKDPMTGTGEFTFASDAYDGLIRLKGKMEGQDVEMTQAVAGKRVGGCTAR
jgi:hypothetical protein